MSDHVGVAYQTVPTALLTMVLAALRDGLDGLLLVRHCLLLQELRTRLQKAIFESVILAGSLISRS